MAIRINGTTVSTNRLNSSNITLEKLNGATVFSGSPPTHIWVLIDETSSEPQVSVGIVVSGSGLPALITAYPPNNYSIGMTAAVWDGSTTYRVYQVQAG